MKNNITTSQNEVHQSAARLNSNLLQDKASSSDILNSILNNEPTDRDNIKNEDDPDTPGEAGCIETNENPNKPKGTGGAAIATTNPISEMRQQFLNSDDKEISIEALVHHKNYLDIYGKEYLVKQATEIAIKNPDVIGPLTVDSRGQIYQGNAFFEAMKAIARKHVEIRVIDLPESEICQLMIVANSVGSGKPMETLYREIKVLRTIYINKQGQKSCNTDNKEKYKAVKFIASKVGQSETTVYRLETIGDVCPAFLKRLTNSRTNANDKYTIHSAYKHSIEFRRKRSENTDPESPWNYWGNVMANPHNELTADQVTKLCEAKPKKLSTSNYDSDEVTITTPVRYNFSNLPTNASDEDVFIRLMQHHHSSYTSDNSKHIKLLSIYRKSIDKLITAL
ncbi:MAG: hypothetical protein MUC81_02430 [Bacteroidia bacterium]|jgi:hypothetical protein|nr:hypothetical protein [Bacteroidia bacterium]